MYENLQIAFLKYLEAMHINEPEDYALRVNSLLVNFIRMFIDTNFSSIYEVTNSKFYHDARLKIATSPNMRKANDAENGEISQALKLYIGFLQSKYNPLNAIPADTTIHRKRSASRDVQKEKTFHPDEMTEGAKKHIEQESNYRNIQLRRACIEHWGFQCQCCGFDFAKAYGEALGGQFIEVHHRVPISSYDEEHKVNPIKELIPLCSNCHSVIHRGKNGVLKLKELRNAYQGKKWDIKKIMPDEDEPIKSKES